MTKGVGLLADWISDLSLQQQAVLVLALRGPDGFPKQHPSKEVLYHYPGVGDQSSASWSDAAPQRKMRFASFAPEFCK